MVLSFQHNYVIRTAWEINCFKSLHTIEMDYPDVKGLKNNLFSKLNIWHYHWITVRYYKMGNAALYLLITREVIYAIHSSIGGKYARISAKAEEYNKKIYNAIAIIGRVWATHSAG